MGDISAKFAFLRFVGWVKKALSLLVTKILKNFRNTWLIFRNKTSIRKFIHVLSTLVMPKMRPPHGRKMPAKNLPMHKVKHVVVRGRMLDACVTMSSYTQINKAAQANCVWEFRVMNNKVSIFYSTHTHIKHLFALSAHSHHHHPSSEHR